MGPATALRSFFGRYFDVNGRSRRFEYFWILVIQTAGFFVGVALIALNEGSVSELASDELGLLSQFILGVMALWTFGTLVPWLTLNVRRFHDMGYSGWLVALFMGLWFIPPLGFIGSMVQFFWVLLGSGTAGLNAYGQDPRFSTASAFG